MLNLTPEKGLAFRITHISNVAWIAQNGLHCANSAHQDANFVAIGNSDLIDKRASRVVPEAPGGTLSDYVPFYFTPRSMMMYNIKTGYSVPKQKNQDIAIIATSIPKLIKQGVAYLFTDRHAYTNYAKFTSDTSELQSLAWDLWRNIDFRRDNEDIGKTDRYQAELLVYQHVPLTSVLGVIAYDGVAKAKIDAMLQGSPLEGSAHIKPTWYF